MIKKKSSGYYLGKNKQAAKGNFKKPISFYHKLEMKKPTIFLNFFCISINTQNIELVKFDNNKT